jgi:hypothetical protein
MRWERGPVCVPIAWFCGRVSVLAVLGSGVQISKLADRWIPIHWLPHYSFLTILTPDVYCQKLHYNDYSSILQTTFPKRRTTLRYL